MSRFKPCPFCGSHPHHGLGKTQHDQLHGEPFQDFRIWCTAGHATVIGNDQAQATEKWNTRPVQDAAVSEERDRWHSAVHVVCFQTRHVKMYDEIVEKAGSAREPSGCGVNEAKSPRAIITGVY